MFPIYNPDLFWHLHAGAWILAHRAVPRAERWSFTRAGAPWDDFEWLAQVAAQVFYARSGLGGVWLLKAALVCACLFALWRAIPASRPARAALVSLWAAGALAFSDARPDLVSVLFVIALLDRLERRRLGEEPRAGRLAGALGVGFVFAVWANVHAGFFLGWLVLGVYAAELLARGRREDARRTLAELGLACSGTLLNPYGLGPHLVSLTHWRQSAELTAGIAEWGRLGFGHPLYLPFWALAALLAASLAWYFGPARRRLVEAPWAPLVLAALLAAAAVAHERLVSFADAGLAVALGVLWRELSPGAGACAACQAACAAFLLWVLPKTNWYGPFYPKYVPVRAAEFMARDRDVFEPLRPFNQWEWGGYLSWRLPWLKVFADGRYVFHDLLPAMQAAGKDPRAWQAFLSAQGADAAVVSNLDAAFPTTRRYPGGAEKRFQRPWYLFYFPRERWALVYWDEQALIFVRRDRVRGDWLEAHEYTLVRPKDDAAFQDALARRELDSERLAEERFRHRREEDIARRCRWSDACAWKPLSL